MPDRMQLQSFYLCAAHKGFILDYYPLLEAKILPGIMLVSMELIQLYTLKSTKFSIGNANTEFRN